MDNIFLRKKTGEFLRKARAIAKGSKCMICGKSCTSFCASHSLPRFIIKEIAESGKVFTSSHCIKDDVIKNILKSNPGVNEVFTFYLICNECDNEFFKEVENRDKILAKFQNHEYNLIALKSLFKDYYTKLINSNLINISSEEMNKPEFLLMTIPWVYDIWEGSSEINDYLDAFNNGCEIRNTIILDEILPYKVDFSCLTKVTPKYSINGVFINDLDNPDNLFNKFGQMFISVFPFEDKTRVLVYFRKKYNSFLEIKNEFDKMTLDEKLRNLSFLILFYSEEVIYNSNVSDKFEQLKFLSSSNLFNNISQEEYLKIKKKFDDLNISLFN